jgi:hypothetical protein
MYGFLRFLEWLLRKLALRIQYYVVIHSYHKRIVRFRIKNKDLFKAGYDRQMLKQFVKKWSVFKHPFSTEPFRVYSVTSGISSANFVPDNLFYWIIEPTLNRLKTNFAYADKNFYEKFYTPELFPRGILHGVNNNFFDCDYGLINTLDQDLLENLLADFTRVILKPTLDTRGGKNIECFERVNGAFINNSNQRLSPEYLNKMRNSDFIIQEAIASHPFYSHFNPSSLNTIRMITYRSVKTGNIEVLCGIIRFGVPGCLTDNMHSGGAAVGITESGDVCSFGIDADANIIYHVPHNPSIRFSDIGKAYNFDRMADAVRKIASQILNFGLISFDVCTDESGCPRIIEINIGNQESAFIQAINGPLFGDFTDEILDYCLMNKKVRSPVLL